MSHVIVILICICLIISDLKHLFICLLTRYMSSLGKKKINLDLVPFCDWVACLHAVWCCESLVSFWDSSLVGYIIWECFLPVGCLFVLFNFSFAVQMHLSGSHLFIFVYISFILRNRSKRYPLIYVPECHACVFL